MTTEPIYDPLLDNLVFHDHPVALDDLTDVATAGGVEGDVLALQAGTWSPLTLPEASTLMVDTKENILASTPASPGIAFGSDTLLFYVYDGSNWRVADIRIGVAGTDMGSEANSPRQGYHHEWITDKKLHNVTLQGFSGTPANGSIRINIEETPDTLEIYMRDTDWYTLVYDMTTENGDFRHTPLTEQIYVWRGDSVAVGLNGRPIVSEYEVSMGSYPPPRVLFGGTF